MQKLEELYRGKAKTIFACDDESKVIMHYRDDATAFNAKKHAELARKGLVNNYFNAFIMRYLQVHGIPTHFERLLNSRESLVKRLTMIPVECVVRNKAAGSICQRLGIEEGRDLSPPVFEFFYKDDSLNDPLINDSHIVSFDVASRADIEEMKALTFKVNNALHPLFENAGLILVDYKLEFGRYNNQITLGDEFTPDGCRLWDSKTSEKMDKDRFRKDLGNVIEAYEEVCHRLGIELPND
jgi:phosphoribosylaminoimidazole-succinocarboxamide synthase